MPSASWGCPIALYRSIAAKAVIWNKVRVQFTISKSFPDVNTYKVTVTNGFIANDLAKIANPSIRTSIPTGSNTVWTVATTTGDLVAEGLKSLATGSTHYIAFALNLEGVDADGTAKTIGKVKFVAGTTAAAGVVQAYTALEIGKESAGEAVDVRITVQYIGKTVQYDNAAFLNL